MSVPTTDALSGQSGPKWRKVAFEPSRACFPSTLTFFPTRFGSQSGKRSSPTGSVPIEQTWIGLHGVWGSRSPCCEVRRTARGGVLLRSCHLPCSHHSLHRALVLHLHASPSSPPACQSACSPTPGLLPAATRPPSPAPLLGPSTAEERSIHSPSAVEGLAPRGPPGCAPPPPALEQAMLGAARVQRGGCPASSGCPHPRHPSPQTRFRPGLAVRPPGPLMRTAPPVSKKPSHPLSLLAGQHSTRTGGTEPTANQHNRLHQAEHSQHAHNPILGRWVVGVVTVVSQCG